MALENKTGFIRVRVTPTQQERFREKAEEEGRRVSEWLRELAMRETRTEQVGA